MSYHPDADLESDASSTADIIDNGNEVDAEPSPNDNFQSNVKSII